MIWNKMFMHQMYRDRNFNREDLSERLESVRISSAIFFTRWQTNPECVLWSPVNAYVSKTFGVRRVRTSAEMLSESDCESASKCVSCVMLSAKRPHFYVQLVVPQAGCGMLR